MTKVLGIPLFAYIDLFSFTLCVYFHSSRMDRNFSDMYQKDAAATCNTTTLGTLSGNDNVTSSDQLESDVLLSIKQEQMVGSCNVCFCQQLPVAFVCVYELWSVDIVKVSVHNEHCIYFLRK